jgi:hypothetical protein
MYDSGQKPSIEGNSNLTRNEYLTSVRMSWSGYE